MRAKKQPSLLLLVKCQFMAHAWFEKKVRFICLFCFLLIFVPMKGRAGFKLWNMLLFWKQGFYSEKKLIYFLLCNMEILTRKYDLCESVSSIIYLENVHLQTKNHIGLNSFLLKWTLDFTLLLDDQNFFSSIHLCPSNGIQIWSPSVIQRLFGIEVH